MRKELKKIEEVRTTFTAEFERYGSKKNWHGYPEKTVLLINVKTLEGKLVTDHIWFSMTKGFIKIGELQKGDVIQFDSRVKKYIKGYAGYRQDLEVDKPIEQDYKLNNPTKIMKQEKA